MDECSRLTSYTGVFNNTFEFNSKLIMLMIVACFRLMFVKRRLSTRPVSVRLVAPDVYKTVAPCSLVDNIVK